MRRGFARSALAPPPLRLHELPSDARRDPRGLPTTGVEDGRRLPDAQPDPPGARVHPEMRAGDRGWSAGPSADGRHEVRRRAAGRPDALLRGPVRRLLPARPVRTRTTIA